MAAKEKGKVGRPRKYQETPKAFLVRLEPSLYRRLQHYRIDHDLSLNDIVTKALEVWIGNKRRAGG